MQASADQLQLRRLPSSFLPSVSAAMKTPSSTRKRSTVDSSPTYQQRSTGPIGLAALIFIPAQPIAFSFNTFSTKDGNRTRVSEEFTCRHKELGHNNMRTRFSLPTRWHCLPLS